MVWVVRDPKVHPVPSHLLWAETPPWKLWVLSQQGFTCGVPPPHPSSALPPCAWPGVLASQRWRARRSSASFGSFRGSEAGTGSSFLGAHSLRFGSFPYPRHCSWKVSCGVILRKYKEKKKTSLHFGLDWGFCCVILNVTSIRELQLSVSTGCFSKLKAETQFKSMTIKYQSCCK